MEYKKEIEIEIGVEVKCWDCGEDLKVRSQEQDSYGDIIVKVEQCDCREQTND